MREGDRKYPNPTGGEREPTCKQHAMAIVVPWLTNETTVIEMTAMAREPGRQALA